MRMLPALALLLLAGCFGNFHQVDGARLDLGNPSVAWPAMRLPLNAITVSAPEPLMTAEIEYRLLYADALHRRAYAGSRWTAPPAYLIELALNRQPPNRGGGCRLRLALDNLAQLFDTPQTSRTVLEVRAGLLEPGRDAVLVRRAFSIARPAPTPDAHGAVAATAAAVQALADELGAWLEQLSRDNPALAAQCGAA